VLKVDEGDHDYYVSVEPSPSLNPSPSVCRHWGSIKVGKCGSGELVQERTIIDLLPDRSKAAVSERLFTFRDKKNIRLVTMDMSRPYRDSVRAILPSVPPPSVGSTIIAEGVKGRCARPAGRP
jgi:hypothetical protein